MNFYDLKLPNFEDCICLINDFCNHQLIKGFSSSTIDLYTSEAVKFLSIISPVDIQKKYVIDYIMSFNKKSTSYKNKRLTALRVILKYLFNQGFNNCDIKIDYIKSVVKIPEFVSENTMKNLINTFKNLKLKHYSIWKGRRDYAILLFLYATGLRASEVVRFQFTDLENGWIRVEKGKGSKDRYVPIAPVAIRALEDYRKYIPQWIKSSYSEFFITDKLVPFTRLTLNNYCNRIFKMNPHLFRHTFATHLIINGCDVYVLSDFLGHSSLDTTQIYTHIQPYHLQNTVINFHPLSVTDLEQKL